MRRNVLSQQSRVGWDCLHTGDDRDLETTPDAARFGSQCQQRSAGGWESERCQEDAANSAGRRRTLPRGGRWRLRSPNLREHSRIAQRLKICQSQGLDPQTAAKLGVRPEGRAESQPTENRPPAPGMRLWRELHHPGRWSLSRYSPRRSARIHAAPAIAKVSAVSLQFV